jgi:hypothetical protein
MHLTSPAGWCWAHRRTVINGSEALCSLLLLATWRLALSTSLAARTRQDISHIRTPRRCKNTLDPADQSNGLQGTAIIMTRTATSRQPSKRCLDLTKHLPSKPSVARLDSALLPAYWSAVLPLHHYFPIHPCTDELCDCVLGKKTDVSPSVDFKGVLAHEEPMTGAGDIGNW